MMMTLSDAGHHGEQDDDDDDDPFACFDRSSSDSNSHSSSSSSSSRQREDDDQSGHRRYLVDQANASIDRRRLADEQRASAMNLRPLISGDYEVFDDDCTTTTTTTTTALSHSSTNTTTMDRVSRGKGLRALRSYKIGDEILREGAVMRIPNQQSALTLEDAVAVHSSLIAQAFEALSPLTQQAIQELSVCDQWTQVDPHVLGVYQTNSFQLRGETDGGLFLTVARINHSCRPNAHHVWRPDLQQMVVMCCAPIEIGHEMLLCYGPPVSLDTAGRRDFLQDRFSFVCFCSMCLEENAEGGDDRMRTIQILRDEVSLPALVGGSRKQSKKTLGKVERCIKLLQDQGLGGGGFMSSLLHLGYQNSCGQLQARFYLERELTAVQQSEGHGCLRAIEIAHQLKQEWVHE